MIENTFILTDKSWFKTKYPSKFSSLLVFLKFASLIIRIMYHKLLIWNPREDVHCRELAALNDLRVRKTIDPWQALIRIVFWVWILIVGQLLTFFQVLFKNLRYISWKLATALRFDIVEFLYYFDLVKRKQKIGRNRWSSVICQIYSKLECFF